MTQKRKTQGARRSEHEWHALILRHQTSGLGVDAFCRAEAISESAFYRWRSIFRDRHDLASDAGNREAFVDLGALNSAGTATSRLEIKLSLGDGLMLHLVRG